MFIRRLARAFACASLVLFGAESSRSQDRQPETPRYRTEVAAVLVDVLVNDSDGRPVRGLTREAFEVFEDGVPQTIQSFDAIDFAAPLASGSGGARDDVDGRQSSARASFARRFVFVLNRQGAEFRLMMRAKEALEAFVLESMAAGDEAMVVDMSQTTEIVEPFTTSKERVLRAVRDIPALRADTFYGTRVATENVYRDLSSLADGLGSFPGRKVVIFMSPTLTKTRDLTTVLRKTIASLNSVNATVYSVNIVGVDPVAASAETSMEAVSDPRAPTVTADTGPPVPELDTIEVGGMFPLAHETGGRYFINTNVFEPAVRSVGRENEHYYVLTYTPTSRALDERYRRIRVTVDVPNVRVRARKGYFATSAAQDSTAVLPGAGDELRLSSLVAFTHYDRSATSNELPVRPRSTIPRGRDVFLYFRVHPGSGREPSRSVELVCTIYQGDQRVQSFGQPSALDLTQSDATGVVVVTELPTGKLAPGVYRIVVEASDVVLGRRARGEVELTVMP